MLRKTQICKKINGVIGNLYYYSIAISKNPLNRGFTYGSPHLLEAGTRVKVQFAKRKKAQIGYVLSESEITAENKTFKIKEISEIVDQKPLMENAYYQLLNWVRDYYLNPPGVVYDLIYKNVPEALSDKSKKRNIPKIPRNSGSKEVLVVSKKITDFPMTRISDTGMKIIQYLYFFPDQTLSEIKEGIGLKSISPIKTLLQNHILEKKQVTETSPENQKAVVELTDEQQQVVQDFFKETAKGNKKHLLYGITGSGKTEVYFDIMAEYLQKGRQTLFLLPEIALTSQIKRRIKSRFPEKKVVLYHSALTAAGKRRIVEDALKGQIDILVGTRSAMWVPLTKLGIVIVDEEHDESFMQSDGIPVYDTKKAVAKLCELKEIPFIFGSATPEIETYHKALNGDFITHQLKTRPGGLTLPEVTNIDLTKTEMIRGFLTQTVIKAIDETLSNQGQCMILTGKKGYASYVSCGLCKHIIKCPNCDVSLTYHKNSNLLKCHYCGHTVEFEHSCPACGNHSLIPRGFGSERVEDQIQLLFPDSKILRVDRDNTPRESDLIKAWERIENRQVDIIVGTRLISKGLNFPNIQLVVILNADQMLYFPDFRSTERTFSLIHQMSGRAGRGRKNARVIVQSYSPDTSSIRFAEKNDYESFFDSEINIRKAAEYPPFADLILFESKDEDKNKALERLERLADFIEESENLNNIQILGPVEAFISRISGKFRFHMLVKSKTENEEIERFKRIIKENDKYIRDISVIIDPRKTII